jgi:hypothetical protein
MVRWLSFLLTAFTCLTTWGDPLPPAVRGVVVSSPGVSVVESKAYATQHDKLLLSDYLESSRPGDEHDQMLRKKLERAQRAWLGGDVELARTEFRTLTELSLKADWRAAQREVLQTAYLRLAQSSDSQSDRAGWLETCARLFGDVKPNSTLFPPPLLNEYETALARINLNRIDIDLSDVFPDFRFVLIDGRKIEVALTSRVQLTEGVHRLTALSDSHESVTEFLTAAQLRVFRVSPPSLTDGFCEAARLRPQTEIPSTLNVEIYSGAKCPAKIDGLLKNSRFLSESHQPEIPDAPKVSNDRTWLWVVGAAVIAGAGYALATHGSSAPTPMHRSGF